MTGYCQSILHNIFNILCICATIALGIWCCYEFSKDEDTCEVLNKRFLVDEDSVYPSITLLLANLFNETILKEYNENFTRMDYQKHLLVNSDPKMFNIDHERVSMNAEDYVSTTCLFKNFDEMISGICNPYTKIQTTSYIHMTAVTFQFPQKETLHGIAIKLKTTIFEGRKRPTNPEDPLHTLLICFSFENQLYPSFTTCFDTWPTRNEQSTKQYSMNFFLKSMETLRRRNKRSRTCYHGSDYDEMIRKQIIDSVGCRPSYWSSNTTKPKCSSNEEYQSIMAHLFDQSSRTNTSKDYLEPCIDIERLQIEYSESDHEKFPYGEKDNDDDDWLMIKYIIQATKFKEIKQNRAYSTQSLIGNLGGYIGLFLGYALLNLPSMALEIWITLNKVRKRYRKEVSSNAKNCVNHDDLIEKLQLGKRDEIA